MPSRPSIPSINVILLEFEDHPWKHVDYGSILIKRVNMSDWLSAEEAMLRLGVRPQTLYAYVSRGRVRAEADPADPRRSRYRAGDIAALSGRKARSRKVADVAADAIAWGEPVLASAITTVSDGRLYYRGQDAAALAETETLEAVARLLRGGAGAPLSRPRRAHRAETMRGRAFALLAARAAEDPAAGGQGAAALAHEAAGLLDDLADAVAGEGGFGAIHERLGQAWGCGRQQSDLIRRALVLLADHELNASTFAARVAASTGASLAASSLAGLSALAGPLHGGMARRVELFAADAGRLGVAGAISAWDQRGSPPPGFGHPLYPDGDVRAAALLAAFDPPTDLAALQGKVEAITGLTANIDFALVALARHLCLPDDAPFTLFAVARCAGWIAHALEQLETGALIRPRARYIGPAPQTLAPATGRGRRQAPALLSEDDLIGANSD
jgi:citrate synthase